MTRICLLLAFAACGSKAAPKPAETQAVVESKLTSNGVDIVYDVRGKGEPTLVFVHCWSCDRTVWSGQVDEFAKDHRIVTLDLAGHGESTATRTEWSIASLGGDVQAVVEKLDLKNVVLVGHSMGGPVSLDAARRMPDRVKGVVCADTLHDASPQMPPEMREQIIKGFETNWEGTMEQGMKIMFHPSTDPAISARVREKSLAANKDVALPLMRELMRLDLAALLSAVKVPIRCINVAPYNQFTPKTNIEGNKKLADFDAVIIEGTGHFVQVEKPAEFNAKMREVLAAMKW